MDRILIGTITVVLDGPALHGLSEHERNSVAEGFLSALRVIVDARGYPFRVILELESTWSGCVKAKIKVWLVATGFVLTSATTFVIKYPDFRKALPVLVKDAGDAYHCRIRNEDAACIAVMTTLGITRELYHVKNGDTLSRIVSEVWHIPAARRHQFMLATLRSNPEAFDGNDLNRLRAGAILACPTEAMVKGIIGTPKT